MKVYNQALPIRRAVGDQRGEATTLTNIGAVYSTIGQPQEALKVYNQALPIRRAVGDRGGEATTLNNIGAVYSTIGQPQEALKVHNQALPISRAVGDRLGEASTLTNIGLIYRDANRPTEAITNWEQAVKLMLETRGGLNQGNRSQFLQDRRGATVALVSLLIDRGFPDQAYEWANLSTTADLIDYTRLMDAVPVKDSQARKKIEDWNQLNQQLQFLRQRLQEPGKFSEALSRQMQELQAQVNREREAMRREFPEVAELFETTPTDITNLRANIPAGTTVIHPVLLTGITNVPDTIAVFVLTRDQVTVTKVNIDPAKFQAVLTQVYDQLNNRYDDQFYDSLAQLYDQLIRPIEAEIKATGSTQLSIIATGRLRYIPFEALYNSKTDEYLIQKYPVSYLTRLSSRALQTANPKNLGSQPKTLFALGNPVSTKPYQLPGSETEVNRIAQIFPGSEVFIGSKATLDAFKLQSPRFSLLHLATHGCFQKGGCPKLGLKENTLLSAIPNSKFLEAETLDLSFKSSLFEES